MTAPNRQVTFDSRSLSIDGKRRLLISGEIHYARVPRSEWERVLDRTKEAGVNCIATYVFWGVHEPRQGRFDFSGGADISTFLHLCRERDLDTIVRMGPYICAEWNYGGFPAWLRDIPGVVTRTWNEPYITCLKNYFRVLTAELLPHLATRGGSMILAQVENEYNNIGKRYGAEGQKYMAWIIEYVKSLGLDIPTLMCEGGAPGAIESVNGFSVHASALKLRESHPDIPLLWTENWPSWYNTWGYEHHLRDAGEIGYEVLRFIAVGGSGFNYYMWHGGTNFGRTAMFLQTTSYDFDAPINEYVEPTGKSRLLQKLHHALLDHQDLLLTGERSQEISVEDASVFTVLWRSSEEKLLVSINGTTTARALSCGADSLGRHPAASAAIWSWQGGAWKPLWKSWSAKPAPAVASAWKPAAAKAPWLSYTEPDVATRLDGVASVEPIEQLSLTHDDSDYCWYVTETTATKTGPATLRITYGGDFFYVFVNGRLVDQTKGQLLEARGPTVPLTQANVVMVNPVEEETVRSGRSGYEHLFSVPLKKGKNRIAILACSLGLIKGDWQLALPMNFERKGIWNKVELNGKPLRKWHHYPALMGERLHLPLAESDELARVTWKSTARPAPLTWYLKRFRLSPADLKADSVWALDAKGLDKGLAWINGHGVGRFWQIPADGYGIDAHWHPPIISTTGKGEPTQRFYRIPPAWLREENRLVIFSESGAKPSSAALVRRPYLKK